VCQMPKATLKITQRLRAALFSTEKLAAYCEQKKKDGAWVRGEEKEFHCWDLVSKGVPRSRIKNLIVRERATLT